MESAADVLTLFLHVLNWIALLYFAYISLYTLLFSISGFFYRNSVRSGIDKAKILVLIPAYMEDNVINDVAKTALKHDYDKDKYDVAIIADSFKKTTLDKLSHLNDLIIHSVIFENSTKVKSLQFALANIDRKYDLVAVLDADNIMQPGFLTEINNAFQSGELAIQGKRIALNRSNSMSLLDGLSEEINNHIYRKGSVTLGLSCPLIGSGMAIEYGWFKKLITQMSAVGGFDRDMEVRLLKEGIKVAYIENAVVLDEKVSDSSGFSNQRRRWMSSQWIYLIRHLREGLKSLLRLEIALFNSAIARNLILPRLLNTGILFVIMLLSAIFSGSNSTETFLWTGIFFTYFVANVLAIPRKYLNRKLLAAIVYLPKMFLILFLNMFKLKGADKKFIHTPHYGEKK